MHLSKSLLGITRIAIFAGLLVVTLAACMPVTGPSPAVDGGSDRAEDPESAAMEAFARAHLLSIDGDFAASLAAIDESIAIDPDSAFLLLTRAEILLHLGRLEEAKLALEAALARDAGLTAASLTLAEIEASRGRHAAAIELLTEAQRLKPDDDLIALNLALNHARNQDPAGATAILQGLLERSPDNNDARLALARIYQMTNRPDDAIEAYRQLLQLEAGYEQAALELGNLHLELGQPDQAERLYLAYLEADPRSNRMRYQLVRIFLDQNRLEPALQQLQLIVEENPEDLDAHYKIGLIRLQQKQPDLAETSFRSVLAHSSDTATRYALGVALEEGGKWQAALTIFEEIEADSDYFADALIHRAYLLPKLNRLDDAISLLEDRIGDDGAMPELFEYLAFLYSQKEDWAGGKRVLADGLKRFPDNLSILLRQALFLDMAGETDAALATGYRVLELDPENAEGMNFVAYSLAVQGIRLDEAEQLVLKSLQLVDAPHVHDTYGWVLYRQGRYAEALVELEKAAEILGDDPVVLEHLGDTLRALGRLDAAIEAYGRALQQERVKDPEMIQDKIDTLTKGESK